MKAYLSDSLISESLILLLTMKQSNCFSAAQINSIKTYYGINKTAALEMALQCNWVSMTNDTVYEITPYGEKLLRSFNNMQISKDLYRDILFNYIVVCKPIWARKIPYGRREAYRIMSEDEQICFIKAGLMNEPVTRDEVDWWDSIAILERKETENQQEDVGRKGEELTIQYELNRTKAVPVWESIDSNLAGYDILSQLSELDTRRLLIEVKSSTRDFQDAYFYVSQNEWSFASAGCNQNRYKFYIWHLKGDTQLATVSYFEIAKHIPIDSGYGAWDSVKIPFSAFKEAFNSVKV